VVELFNTSLEVWEGFLPSLESFFGSFVRFENSSLEWILLCVKSDLFSPGRQMAFKKYSVTGAEYSEPANGVALTDFFTFDKIKTIFCVISLPLRPLNYRESPIPTVLAVVLPTYTLPHFFPSRPCF